MKFCLSVFFSQLIRGFIHSFKNIKVFFTRIKSNKVTTKFLFFGFLSLYFIVNTQQITRWHGDVAITSLCTSQQRRRYVSNETPNDVSVKYCQDVSVVRLHNVILERCENVSRGRNNNFQLVRLHDILISIKWNTQKRLSGTSQRRLSDMYQYVSVLSLQVSLWWIPTGRFLRLV